MSIELLVEAIEWVEASEDETVSLLEVESDDSEVVDDLAKISRGMLSVD